MIHRAEDWWYKASAIDDDDRAFDREFWQAQGPDAIFRAAWDLVETAWKLKGRDLSELRLQRSAFVIEPISR